MVKIRSSENLMLHKNIENLLNKINGKISSVLVVVVTSRKGIKNLIKSNVSLIDMFIMYYVWK